MDEKERMDFKFTEHQLGVVDSKANNILMVDSVLIVISQFPSYLNQNRLILS